MRVSEISCLRALYGFLSADVDKSVWVWYEDGLMTIYTSNQQSHLTESEHNEELTQR